MLLWCSISVSRITSPDLRFFKPQEFAMRLMPSVVPRVKMISSALRALMNFAADVRSGAFPSESETYANPEDLLN